MNPFTKYTPSLGFYSSRHRSVIRRHIRAMEYAGLSAGISSWWGRGTQTDRAFRRILSITAATSKTFHWSVYYEGEAHGDPSVAQIRSDLHYLNSRYWDRPSYLHIGKRPVIFVYADPNDGCSMVARWRAANDVQAFVVLKVFPGYQGCSVQPSGWHQYAPTVAVERERRYSYSISPGFWKANETTPRLARGLSRWRADIRAMLRSRARFQLVTTFNEWGEGTAVESAWQWRSPSRYGLYLDALHNALTRSHRSATGQQPGLK
jgi:Glycosyl hydrolase family 99